jgi:uncharacterized protein YecT (DUF1311 family)
MVTNDARALLIAATWCAVTPILTTQLFGAEFDVDLERNQCEIRVSGTIVLGDLAKLKSKLPRGYEVGKAGPTMCLNSPGGDFVEGLSIAEFVADGFSTYLESGAVCASACSWIFMAGTNQSTGGSSLSRSMHYRSSLVFHAPYIDASTIVKEPTARPQALGPEEAIRAYNQAVSEIGKGVLKLASRRTTFDLLPLIESSLVAEALINADKSLLYIDTVAKAVRWNIPVEGITGPLPKTKNDVVMACRNALAYANDFWDWDFLYSTKAIEYIAFYDKDQRTLSAQIVLESIASGACEVNIKFSQDLREVESIDAIANLSWENSIGSQWIKGTRGERSVGLPNFVAANPSALLAKLGGRSATSVDLRPLITVTQPAWCSQQARKGNDETTICARARLAAYDVVMAQFYAEGLAQSTAQERAHLQADQQQWLGKRRACGNDEDCLDRVYHERIRAMREHN